MTKKEEFENKGYDVIDNRETIDEEQNHLLEFLKNNYPSIYKDSEINIEELKRVLNDKSVVAYKENGYGLNFIGRNLAKAKYRQKTKKELIINEKLSKNFDETENIIIKGDNLDSLKILKKYYSGKIKCIYIDPPYNTNSDNFLYPDRFDREELEVLGLQDIGEEEYDRMEFIFKKSKKSHNGWLTFMYPRLKLARDLLTDDGAIFISIDDNEQANLKLLCDEIFGEDNFVYQLSVANKLNGNDNSSGMMETEEYCLIYAKCKYKFSIGELKIDELENDEWEEDDLGYWKKGRNLKATGENAPREKRKNLFFPIYIDEKKLTFSLRKNNNYSYELLPMTNGEEMSWYWSKEKFLNEKDEVIIKKVGNSYSLYKKQRPALGDIPTKRGKTTFYSSQYSTANSNKNIKDLFDNKKVFNYSKSKYLIKDFIYLSNISKNDIVLDFFAGSGTTAHAVMELNVEDGGNRKFILCQIDEKITKEKSAAYDFCIDNKFETVISSITIERVNRAGEKIIKTLKDSDDKFDNKRIDIGYKVFDLHDINDIKENEDGQIEIISNGVVNLSRIYNMIINIGLNSPISKLTTIIENCAYMIEEDNIKTYYITNCEILIKNDENKQKFKDMIESGNIYIDGWTVNINVSLQQYKDNVKIVL